MYNYKLTIQYDGGRYKGWQRLGNGENTIQDKIEQVLSQMLEHETEIIGCSRTDAGVHALAQIANFKTDLILEADRIKAYLNHYLPQDICIMEVSSISEHFHARYNAKNKVYLYKIWNKEYSNPFMRKYSMQVYDKLNVKAMKAASEYFIGSHDFAAFSNAKSKKKSTVREIYNIDFQEENGFINIRLRGDGFLYNMVRWIIGSLVEVGLGKLEADRIPGIMEAKERNKAGNLAEACGLYLEKVTY
ncbi:MAG: tRNA pseudouridine(38-40) synthase TruA [Herbinix sp.]|nr:tRNA pseudouridine(38-40) synthase TruA [Herbinix sp.]